MNVGFSMERGKLPAIMARKHELIAHAAGDAADAAARQLKPRARAAIGAGGFSTRFQNAFRVRIYGGNGRSLNTAVFGYDKIPYAGIFAHGGRIGGSPLLWLPLPAAPQRAGRRRLTAGNFSALTGIHLVSFRGGRLPLLGAYASPRAAAGRALKVSQLRAGARRARRGQAASAFGGSTGRFAAKLVPLYVGLSAVNIPQKFDLDPVYRAARETMIKTFLQRLGGG